MRKTIFFLLMMLPAAWRPLPGASGWEWQLSAGPWTIVPFTSPVARQAQRLVSEEANRLLAPLLSDFTVLAFEPRVDLHSRGWSVSAGCWRRLNRDQYALGISASYLDFVLPFVLTAEQDIYFLGIPVAQIRSSGRGQVDLRTFMLAAQGRWRAFQSGRVGIYAGGGLTLLRFSGTLHLPLTASVQTILGKLEKDFNEDLTLAELRAENSDIPAWIVAPALAASLHYRIGTASRLFMEINLSQGTSLAAGFSLGR